MKRSLEQRLEKLEQAAEARETSGSLKVYMATDEEWNLFYEAHPEERESLADKNGQITGLHVHFVTPKGQTPRTPRTLPELEVYFKNGGDL